MSATTWLVPRYATALAVVRLMQDLPVGETLTGPEITVSLGLARRYAEPSLQGLVKAGILHSVRGPKGGYTLSPEADNARVGAIIRAVDDTPGRPIKTLASVSSSLFEWLAQVPVSSLPPMTVPKA